MPYIYHNDPRNMEGDILYPLNQLKNKMPNIYQDQAKKYQGREQVPKQYLNLLDCLWNDVLHFSAVHPQKIKSALDSLGMSSKGFNKCYRIDTELAGFNENNTVFYFTAYSRSQKIEIRERKFNHEAVRNYAEIPKGTLQFYDKRIKENKPVFTHAGITHILFKGTLDVTKHAEIIEF